MGDLKSFCRSFWSLWLRATCSAKHGGRLTWNHLRQRMSFLCYHRLPSTAPPRKKNNCEPPSKLWSAHTWLSHYPASAPYPHTPNQRYRDEKALLIKKKRRKKKERKKLPLGKMGAERLRQRAQFWDGRSAGRLGIWKGRGPGASRIWKLFSWQKLRDAPRTDIPPAVTDSQRATESAQETHANFFHCSYLFIYFCPFP